MKKSFKRLVLLVTVLMFTSGCGGSSDDCSGGLILTIFSGGLLAPTLNDCGSYSSGNDSFYDDCSNRILLEINIYSNIDGLFIPSWSDVRISNQDAEKFKSGFNGHILDWFKPYDTPEALLPCWDLCEDELLGSTRCLEDAETWELLVEAYADGYASQADTLTLDNQSITMNMTFFLDLI